MEKTILDLKGELTLAERFAAFMREGGSVDLSPVVEARLRYLAEDAREALHECSRASGRFEIVK
jgi:hypothetical protein